MHLISTCFNINNYKMKKICLMLILGLFLAACQRNPKIFQLPSLIGDNMVLQQKSEVSFWGKTSPDRKVSITASWNVKAEALADKDGKWNAKIKTPEAGGPYTINISTKDSSLDVKNVMIGEVWFCSGQSNMEMPLEGWPPTDTVMNSAKSIATADVPEIHLFNVARKVSAEPLEDCTARWEVCSPSTVKTFSAAAYFFGKRLHDELHIPIGLIESTWGGTPSEAWTSAEALNKAGVFVQELQATRESAPLIADYQKWLNGLKQLTVGTGDDQWKDLAFDDKNVPLTDYIDSAWSSMTLPGTFESSTGDFDGAVWFRKAVTLPADMTGKDLLLSLGPIDDMDRTYFNGTLVGATETSGQWQVERLYKIPEDLIKSGENIIAVRVLDTQGGGGIYGKPELLKLTVDGNNRMSLNLTGEWKYLPVAELIGNKFFIFGEKGNVFKGVKRPAQVGPSTPSSLYNGMVYPVVKYAIKGAIWYQGEANVGRADQYSEIFPLMIKNWRESWGIGDFPFYFVQIAPYVYSGVDSTESAYLRESQEKALELPNTGMVVTLDVATVMNIHPPYKKEVGERLANLALAKDYGMNIQFSGPVYKSMKKEGRIIKIQFGNVTGGLKTRDGKLTEFEIAGKDGKYVKADAKISGEEVLVTSPRISDPHSVRYCWHNGSVASLFDGNGMPVGQFRTSRN
jgi:sialate O-acetylesterase